MGDQASIVDRLGRRNVLAGLGAGTALLLLPGCESMKRFSLVEAIRRLLYLSTTNAFARLTAPDGFYENQLARLELPRIFGSRGDILGDILISTVFKKRLQRSFNHIAERGADRAAPLVADAVRTIGIENAVALVKGRPTAASEFLRGAMGTSLVEAMVPALGDAMRVADDPLVGQALSRLVGIDVPGVARNFAGDVDNAIWGEIGREEAAIRANPRATNDPAIIAIFGAA
jgi:hypothetical protein